jgi:DNA-binding CsgD family transcriptional regulator
MDQVLSDYSRENERREQVVSALNGGAILIDADDQIVWVDEKTRGRLNGHLRDFVSRVQESNAPAIDCFISPVTLTVNGEQATVCVIRETKRVNRDLIAAFETVLADTSSFTRAVISRLKGLRQLEKSGQSVDLDFLTERERDVLALICQGKSDTEMSKQLSLSENTVRNHVASLYRKIAVNRRSAAIIWARERGISVDALAGKRQKRSSQASREEER